MLRLIPALALLPLSALAEAPAVLVDTAPLHSLVARVMAGVGTPDLLLPPGTSPHDYALRPSDAARLQGAAVMIWTGDALVPWLAAPLATLADEATTLGVLESPGWTVLPMREDAAFAGADDHDDHAGEKADPHAWLDPAIAAVWLGTIAETLAGADPENAAAYRDNASAGAAELAALRAELAADLAPVQGLPFIVPHDAYQYFEVAFGLPAAGAIALSDAAAPGPARVADLRDLVQAGGIACILTDPQTSPEWTALLAEGTLARTALADPDGTGLTPGAALYPALMRGLAAALVACLAEGG